MQLPKLFAQIRERLDPGRSFGKVLPLYHGVLPAYQYFFRQSVGMGRGLPVALPIYTSVAYPPFPAFFEYPHTRKPGATLSRNAAKGEKA